jgi:hypothetical protein
MACGNKKPIRYKDTIMGDTAKIREFLNRLPSPDTSGKFTGPDPADAGKLYQEVLAGGRGALVDLIGQIQEPGKDDDWRARYLLHGLALYACQPGGRQHQPLVVEALILGLDADLPVEARGFLIRELQVAGSVKASKRIAEALGKRLTDDDLCEPAAQALLAIREGAAGEFRKALGAAQGKNRATIIQALGVLGDRQSVGALKQALADSDPDTRLAAAFALAASGDASAADPLLKAADVADVWERDQVSNFCLLLAEKLVAAGRKDDAKRIYQRLRDRKRPEDRHVKQAATIGLLSTAKSP